MSPEYAAGEEQDAGAEPSREQRKVAPRWFAVNVNVAVVWSVVPYGPDVIVT